MTLRISGLITVRSQSSRLPNKCFLSLNGIILLQHIITRCITGGIEPIICTTNNLKDRKIVGLAKKNKIKFFAGSEKNKILRWYDCCKKFHVKAFHTIDADDPFFDWDSVKKSFKELKSSKKDIILPSKVSRDGAASEGYSVTINCLKKIFSFNKNYKKQNFDTEIIEPFLNRNISKSIFKGSLYEIKNCRLTLDYREDFKLLNKIAQNCGNFNHRKNINLYLKKNKQLLKINFNKNAEWKKKQIKFIEGI